MYCLLCASANQGEFGTEILVHFRGLKNLNNPSSGYSRSCWFAWIAAFLDLPSQKPDWRCLREVTPTTEATIGKWPSVERHDD